MLFILDAQYYVPGKLCRAVDSIHLFKFIGKLLPEHVKFNKHIFWDIIEIDWKKVNMTFNRNKEDLLTSVITPFRDKFKVRRIIKQEPLLFHIILKQGMTCFPLVSKDSSDLVWSFQVIHPEQNDLWTHSPMWFSLWIP